MRSKFLLHAEAAYDSGVLGPPSQEPGKLTPAARNTGAVCAPTSGAQGTKRLKVQKKRKSGGGSTSAGLGVAASKDVGGEEVTRLAILQQKVGEDTARKKAKFASQVLQSQNLPAMVTEAAQKVLLEYFNCPSTTLSDFSKDVVSTGSPTSDSDL